MAGEYDVGPWVEHEPSEPDEGAASPAGPGEAVPAGEALHHEVRAERERCIAIALGCRDYSGGYRGAEMEAYHAGMETVARVLGSPGVDLQRRIVEAIGRGSPEGGAHVDPGALDAAIAERDAGLVERYEVDLAAARAEVERLKAQVVALSGWRDALIGRVPLGEETGPDPVGEYLDSLRAEVARLTADLETVAADRDRYRAGYERVGASAPGALLDRIAEAKRHEDAATVARGEAAVLREALARLTEQAEAVGDVARVLRCEPGDVAGAAQAALEQAALARGEVAGLERALRVLAEVRRG